MTEPLKIGGRWIGRGHPTYIVAEMSANHHGKIDEAIRLIHAAKESGADAVKLQTYTPDTLTLKSDHECFRIGKGTLWQGRTLHDLYGEAYMPWEWQPRLKQVADQIGIDLFSSPFDFTAVEFLEGMGVPAYKIASFEIVDIPLIEKVSRTGKPVIISTGMATLSEIEEAVRAARKAGARQIALLKCTSAYPAPPGEMHLRTIPHLADAFDVPVGLSDHTLGIAVAVASIALGACIVEKHFTFSRSTPGPDSTFSLEPHEFKALVESIRIAEKALGEVRYDVGDTERPSRVFRRSLFVVKEIKGGECFTAENVRSIRPGNGLHPRYLPEVLSRRAKRNLEPGTPLTWSVIDA